MKQDPKMLRKWLITGAMAAGVAIGAAGIAGAATSSTPAPTAAKAAVVTPQGNENTTHETGESATREAAEKAGNAGFGGHGPETAVTGAAADKIKAAALAAVPGTLTKTEQRGDGSYEAEITKADGSDVHVSLDKNFVVTSTNGPGGGHDGGTPDVNNTPGA